jgi:ribokinase
MNASIIVIGSINTDLILTCEHLPAPGETVLGGDIKTVGGGKGANQAVTAARLGAHTRLIGCVGEDAYADLHLQAFAREGIQTGAIRRCANIPSGTAVILVDTKGQNSIVVSPAANAFVSKEDVENAKTHFSVGGILIMQLEIPLETVVFSAQRAKAAGMQVILNPAPAQPLPAALLHNTDFLILNEVEINGISEKPISDEMTLLESVETILYSGVQAVILTLGAKGARYFSKKQQFFQPAFKVDAVDSTAAGDAFVGAFAVALSEHQEPVQAVQFASAAGAITVMNLGAQPSLPARKAVNEFLEKRRI